MGIKYGVWTGVVVLCVNLAIISIQNPLPATPIWMNFIFAYLAIWVISHSYESVRATSDKALRKLALKDTLTECKNRLALTYQFDEFCQEDTLPDLHLLLLDIDYFKLVNDTYGHEAGDNVLKLIAKKVSTITKTDNVFRIGGEEFCVLLSDISKSQAIELAEKIRNSISDNTIEFYGKAISISVSIGVGRIQCTSTLSDLLRSADLSLYEAKRSGRNKVIYCDDLKTIQFQTS